MENPIKMDDLGVALFSETSMSKTLKVYGMGFDRDFSSRQIPA